MQAVRRGAAPKPSPRAQPPLFGYEGRQPHSRSAIPTHSATPPPPPPPPAYSVVRGVRRVRVDVLPDPEPHGGQVLIKQVGLAAVVEADGGAEDEVGDVEGLDQGLGHGPGG